MVETTITLIGARLAKEGMDFIFEGESNECNKCKLKNTCLNLEKGRRYKVVKIKTPSVHECFLHDGGVIAVEVVKSPVIAILDSRKAIKGAKISYEPPKCKEIPDDLYDLFYPQGLRTGDKCTITTIFENIEEEGMCSSPMKKVELQL
ncbi:MAG: UPF0179 family protein [Methanomethylovorans sp.]|uniref:UPF0179 family protein n=1 Tax=Methanomethylovorans sp. TaxID=2758717 RepID=UPI0035305EF6